MDASHACGPQAKNGGALTLCGRVPASGTPRHSCHTCNAARVNCVQASPSASVCCFAAPAQIICVPPPVPAGQIQGGGDKNGCHAQRVHRHRLRPMCWALPCTRTRPLLSRRQWRCHMRASYVHSECMHDPRHRRRLCVVCACMIVHRKLVRGRRVGGHV